MKKERIEVLDIHDYPFGKSRGPSQGSQVRLQSQGSQSHLPPQGSNDSAPTQSPLSQGNRPLTSTPKPSASSVEPVRMQIDVDEELLSQLQNHHTNYSPPPVVRARHRPQRSISRMQVDVDDDQLMNDLWGEPAITTTPPSAATAVPSTVYSFSPPRASQASLHPLSSQSRASRSQSPRPEQSFGASQPAPHLFTPPPLLQASQPFDGPTSPHQSSQVLPSQPPPRLSLDLSPPHASRQPSLPSSRPSSQPVDDLSTTHQVKPPYGGHGLFSSSPDLDLDSRKQASPVQSLSPSHLHGPLDPKPPSQLSSEDKPNWSVANESAFGFLFG